MKIATKPKATPLKRTERKPAAAKAMTVVADRVTVRLKPELAARLATAKRDQGQSVTEIIEAALEKHLPEAPRKPKMTLLEALKKHGVLGAVDLGPNASRDYKQLVAESIAEKYGYR